MRRKNTHCATRALHTTAAARPVSEGALAAVIHRITPMPMFSAKRELLRSLPAQ